MREWLSVLSADDLQISLLHPPGSIGALPDGIHSHPMPVSSGAWGRLRYEQFDLPRAARRLSCQLLLVVDGGAPIASRLPTAALATDRRPGRSPGLVEELRWAAGRAGRSVTRLTLYPDDLPSDRGLPQNGRRFTPFVSAAFDPPPISEPRNHVLCYGVRRQQVALLLAAWSWVDGSLGDTYPLVLLGSSPELEAFVQIAAEELNLNDSIAFRPEVDLTSLSSIYREAAAFLSVEAAASGQTLRWALASGTPVASVDESVAASILGGAGYLAPDGDARALGAACLSLLVQEQLADQLRERGKRIAAKYFEPTVVADLHSLLRAAARS